LTITLPFKEYLPSRYGFYNKLRLELLIVKEEDEVLEILKGL
jgi:hypothetical protein